jgi:hypothetical protein
MGFGTTCKTQERGTPEGCIGVLPGERAAQVNGAAAWADRSQLAPPRTTIWEIVLGVLQIVLQSLEHSIDVVRDGGRVGPPCLVVCVHFGFGSLRLQLVGPF